MSIAPVVMPWNSSLANWDFKKVFIMRHNPTGEEITNQFAHTPVMYREVLATIDEVSANGPAVVVDCTLGEGGHTEMILSRFPSVSMISFERDAEILEIAKKRLAPFEGRVRFVNDNFSRIGKHCDGLEGQIAVILYDFGISSFHFDRSGRGFTYAGDEPLDMRLDQGCPRSAADIVNGYAFNDLARVFGEYGEERWAGKIARAVIARRDAQPIHTTGDLAGIVLGAIPKRFHVKNIHPATRVFQGLRIEVNGELDAIEQSLKDSWIYLARGGRILAISFHSLEDRIAKRIFRDLERGCTCTRNDLCQCDRIPKVKILTRKPLLPTEIETDENRRARSAKMRICERI
jgi:16S rRNA (cytosine1402-N4)-methyltransferase